MTIELHENFRDVATLDRAIRLLEQLKELPSAHNTAEVYGLNHYQVHSYSAGKFFAELEKVLPYAKYLRTFEIRTQVFSEEEMNEEETLKRIHGRTRFYALLYVEGLPAKEIWNEIDAI